MSNNTALLIFARTASEESKHKSFQASEAFFKYQNKKLLKLAEESGLHYFWVDESQQTGKDFAHRYLNAIQSIFDKNFDQVISVGNDSPGLSLKHINQTIDILRSKDMCFGPSMDGGFYLWGVKKTFFKKENFLDLSWRSKKLFSEFLDQLQLQSISTSCLQVLEDLDYPEDARRLLQTAKISFSLKAILLQIINQKQIASLVFQLHLKSKFTDVYYNKGSPKAA